MNTESLHNHTHMLINFYWNTILEIIIDSLHVRLIFYGSDFGGTLRLFNLCIKLCKDIFFKFIIYR